MVVVAVLLPVFGWGRLLRSAVGRRQLLLVLQGWVGRQAGQMEAQVGPLPLLSLEARQLMGTAVGVEQVGSPLP